MSASHAERWMQAAQRDLAMAQSLYQARFYDGCAFHAQQAAEKALKGLLYTLNQLPWGHNCFILLQQIGELLPETLTHPH